MARAPFASWRPLPEQGSEPLINATQFIFHTMVGTLPSTDRFFREVSSLESHFGLGGPWEGAQFDGVLWQWVDTSRRAQANAAANVRAISVETSDGGQFLRSWTPRQIDSLVRLGRWAAETHGIPKRIAPAWDAPGFGWHRLFSEWNPNNHACPGDTRINQLRNEVLPRIFAAVDPGSDDLTPEEHAVLFSLKDHLVDTLRIGFAGDVNRPVRAWAVQLEQVKALLELVAPALLDDEAKVLAAVNAVTDRVGSSQDAVLGALAALNLELSDEQVAAIAAAVDIDEVSVAEAVRFRLSEALSA